MYGSAYGVPLSIELQNIKICTILTKTWHFQCRHERSEAEEETDRRKQQQQPF